MRTGDRAWRTDSAGVTARVYVLGRHACRAVAAHPSGTIRTPEILLFGVPSGASRPQPTRVAAYPEQQHTICHLAYLSRPGTKRRPLPQSPPKQPAQEHLAIRAVELLQRQRLLQPYLHNATGDQARQDT